jgi:hypothetical protein
MYLPRISRAIVENPFYVLGVSPECTRHEFEREGQKLLAMLALDLAEIKTYATPLGERIRTPELVLHSMAELRNPSKRLLHEIIAALPMSEIGATDDPTQFEATDRWIEAPGLFGYGWRRQGWK